MKRLLPAALLLAGCQQQAASPEPSPNAGEALEQAAVAAGLVSDSAKADPTGVFQAGGDLVCLLPRAGGPRTIGVSIDYGAGQRCVAHGTVRGGGRLDVDLGNGCRFDASLDDDLLTFPATLPSACDRACVGRATLAAVRVERLGSAAAEAARARGADGALLCPG